MNYTFLLLLPYTIWCVVFFFSSLLTPRKSLRKPRFLIFLVSLVLLPFIVTINVLTLRNVLLQCFYILICIAFFEESLIKKLSCYIIFQLSGTLVEIIAGNLFLIIRGLITGTTINAALLSEITGVFDIIFMTAFNICIGIYFYYNEVRLLKKCLSYMKPRTFVQLLLPILVPVLLQGFLMMQLKSPAFFIFILIYIFCCLSTYLFFQKGIKNIYVQNQQQLLKIRNMELLKEAISFSKEMEQEYHSLRKWNHDIENHLMSLSYLTNMKKYDEARIYQQTLQHRSL